MEFVVTAIVLIVLALATTWFVDTRRKRNR